MTETSDTPLAQEYQPWGTVRPGTGPISNTTLNYTGQRRDDSGLLLN